MVRRARVESKAKGAGRRVQQFEALDKEFTESGIDAYDDLAQERISHYQVGRSQGICFDETNNTPPPIISTSLMNAVIGGNIAECLFVQV